MSQAFVQHLKLPATLGMRLTYRADKAPAFLAARGTDTRFFNVYRSPDEAEELITLSIDCATQRILWEQTTAWPFAHQSQPLTESDQRGGLVAELINLMIDKHYAPLEEKEKMSRHAIEFLRLLTPELLHSGDPDLRRVYYFIAETLHNEWQAGQP